MRTRLSARRGLDYVIALALATAVTGLIEVVDQFSSIPNVSLLYLPAILLTAVYFGTWPSLVAATTAVLEYDFFLLRPFFTFTIGQVEDLLAFVIFVVVAILTSQLAARARERAETAQRRATESEMLYDLGRALMRTDDVAQVLRVMTERMVYVFGVDRCAVYVPDGDGRLSLAAETPTGDPPDRTALATAAGVYRQGVQVWLPAGDSPSLDQQRSYVPLQAGDKVVGVMEVGRRRGAALDTDEQRLVTSFAAQAALMIARARSEEARHRLAVVEESDRLKSALLNAVSHDLRTPLASIKASATALLLADAGWTTGEGTELLQTIDHEADRLNRLVGNLLDLSRIEAGVLRPVLEWYDVRELVEEVLQRVRPLLGQRQVIVDIEPDPPPIHIDLLRIEELVINLLENAMKHAPATTPIELRIREADGMLVSVVDHGPGVPAHQRQRIFQAFYQGKQLGDREPGTGLGLAICRGVAEAHGGSIDVTETRGGGATFTFRLPASHVGSFDRALELG